MRLLECLWNIIIEDSPVANRGPNAISVVCLRGCWSTVYSIKTFSASKCLDGSGCTMQISHTALYNKMSI